MGIIDAIYNHCPIPAQNILITGYGYKLKRLRYGGNYKYHLAQLLDSQYFSSNEINAIQSKLLNELIQASLHTPYYMEFIKNNNIKPSEINLDNYHKVFPVITKELLRRHQNNFFAHNTNKKEIITISTSGTSGTPLKIQADTNALRMNYAFFNRFLNWSGVGIGDKCATFAGRMFVPQKQTKPPFWRHNYLSNTLLFSSYHISDRNIPSYIKALEHFNPRFIDTYPSAIYEIAKFIITHGYSHKIKPVSIITSSETLYDYQREAIESAFNCKIFDHLGCAEMATFITQCEHGNYHVNPEYGLFEVVDEDYQQVLPNSTGRLICTGLINKAMPLIRYELGDSVTMSTDCCLCGRNFPVVKTIVGRTDDLIIGCDGRKIGRLDPIFKKMDSSIKEAQIIQTDVNQITLKLATDENYNRDNTQILVDELLNRIGDCININVEYVNSIEKTSSGKFKAVVSKIT